MNLSTLILYYIPIIIGPAPQVEGTLYFEFLFANDSNGVIWSIGGGSAVGGYAVSKDAPTERNTPLLPCCHSSLDRGWRGSISPTPNCSPLESFDSK